MPSPLFRDESSLLFCLLGEHLSRSCTRPDGRHLLEFLPLEVRGEMRVYLRDALGCVPEALRDHLEIDACHGRVAGEGMREIVEPVLSGQASSPEPPPEAPRYFVARPEPPEDPRLVQMPWHHLEGF